MQKIFLIGNLGKDAEVKTFEGGGSVINFNIASTEKYTPKGATEPVTKTTWFTCALFKTAAQSTKISEYLKKGTQVHVEGKVEATAWKNEAGEAKAELKVIAREIMLLGGKNENSGTSAPSGAANPATAQGQEDDLPF